MRHWHPFFLHLLFGTLILNIDLLISRFVLDTTDYALYQTGMRLVYAANLVLTVISNIYIPSWTRSDSVSGFNVTNEQFIRVAAVVSGMSIVGVGALYLSGDLLPVLIFGENFRGLGVYLPLFGLLIALRLVGAFVGVLLSCRYAQEYRTIASLVGVALLTTLLIPWLGSYTILYVILVQLVTHIVMDLFLLYGLNQNWKSSVV